MPDPGLADALDLTVRVASVGLVVTAGELIADRRAFGDDGPFSPAVFAAIVGRPDRAWMPGPTSVVALAAVQIAAALVLVAIGPFDVAGRVALCVATVTAMTLRWRRSLGGDGAEQLTVILLVVAVLAVVPGPGDDRVLYAVLFVAAQSALAYLTAGASKLASGVWRRGGALPQILGTEGHGHATAARELAGRPRASAALAWGVMLFEVSFPALVLAPRPVAVTALTLGVAFHAGCAVLMGLNSFVWAFPATYPCLLSARAHLLG